MVNTYKCFLGLKAKGDNLKHFPYEKEKWKSVNFFMKRPFTFLSHSLSFKTLKVKKNLNEPYENAPK